MSLSSVKRRVNCHVESVDHALCVCELSTWTNQDLMTTCAHHLTFNSQLARFL